MSKLYPVMNPKEVRDAIFSSRELSCEILQKFINKKLIECFREESRIPGVTITLKEMRIGGVLPVNFADREYILGKVLSDFTNAGWVIRENKNEESWLFSTK